MAWCFGIGLAVFVLAIGLGWWLRRGEVLPDVGHRSVVTFDVEGDLSDAPEDLAELSEQPGAAVLALLGRAWTKAGVAEPDLGHDAPWWELTWAHEGRRMTIGLREAERGWLARVIVLSGGPAPLPVVEFVDRALRGTKEISKVEWHRREQVFAGDLSGGATKPGD